MLLQILAPEFEAIKDLKNLCKFFYIRRDVYDNVNLINNCEIILQEYEYLSKIARKNNQLYTIDNNDGIDIAIEKIIKMITKTNFKM